MTSLLDRLRLLWQSSLTSPHLNARWSPMTGLKGRAALKPWRSRAHREPLSWGSGILSFILDISSVKHFVLEAPFYKCHAEKKRQVVKWCNVPLQANPVLCWCLLKHPLQNTALRRKKFCGRYGNWENVLVKEKLKKQTIRCCIKTSASSVRSICSFVHFSLEN